MHPDEIAASYDRIAHFWASKGFDAENGLAQHERAIRFTTHRRRALDVGCGSSGRILELLSGYGFDIEGLDISPEMLALARAKFPDVNFLQADICTHELSASYDFISAWDSIWHVPLAAQRAVLQKLCAALHPGGVLIFTAGGLDAPDEVTNPCLGQPLYHATLGIPAILRVLDESGCICRHLEYDQPPEKHLSIIAQKAEPTRENPSA